MASPIETTVQPPYIGKWRVSSVLPGKWRQRVLMLGSAMALSVYYLHYAAGSDNAAGFENGDTGASSPLTLTAKLIAVTLIVLGLIPIRLRIDSAFALTALYCAALASFLGAWAIFGATNDTFFFNTVLQLPILLALSGTRTYLDYPKWFRFIVRLVAVQALLDIAVIATGRNLWGYGAFVGGVGNPSSFGLICVLGCAFCLMHPRAGRHRRPLAVWLAIAAIMTKSLFATLSIFVIALVWASRSWRRMIASVILGCIAATAVSYFAFGAADEGDPSFVVRKMFAAAALVGFTRSDSDVSESGSISARLEIHERTYNAARQQPLQLLIGHFRGLVYWPMDSQILTYLGSFGLPILLAFLSIDLLWTYRAWRNPAADGGFGVLTMLLFTFIFLTNRILDYFPMASVYFLCVMASRRRDLSANASAGKFSVGQREPWRPVE